MKTKTSTLGALLAVVCLSGSTWGARIADVTGTYSVTFQPLTTAGQLKGCSLIYNVMMLDYVYQNGAPVLAVGNITYNQSEQHPGLSLKLGVSNVLGGEPTAAPPHHAFIRTKNGTTAGAKFVSYDSDVSGYRVFVYQLTEKSVKVIEDLLEGETPTVGFNRNENGVDATFQIDLTVEDVAESSPGHIQRKRSTAAIEGFVGCFSELAAALK
jgi:hypothetical protein